MRDILIIFCVLLVVLIIISTLGGSIRPDVQKFTNDTMPALPAMPTMSVEAEQPALKAIIDDAMPSMQQTMQSMQQSMQQTTEQFVENTAAVSGYDGADSFAAI